MTDGRRIDNLPPEAWTPQVEEMFPILVPPGATVKGSDFNSLLVLAHHPGVAEPFLRFNAAVGRGVVLPARLREVAILRLAWRRKCLYEWVHHLHGGDVAGLTVDHFRALATEGMADLFLPDERAVVAATDELCVEASISDRTWAALGEHLDTPQVLELLFVVGCFLTVAMLLNSAKVDLEAGFMDMAMARGWPMI